MLRPMNRILSAAKWFAATLMLGALVIPADLRGRITEGATLAVSLEPFGGSPTGQATGPVIAVGQTYRR